MSDAEQLEPTAAPGIAPDPVRGRPVAPDATRPVARRRTSIAGKRRAKARTRHTVLKVLVSTVVALALVTGLSAAYLYRHLNGNLHVYDAGKDIIGDQPTALAVAGPKKPLNILVMGSDSRDCSGCDVDGLTKGGQRSDTTILIHLSADRKRAYGISIPRDSIVDRPACKTSSGSVSPAATAQMWNAAFSVGGPACTISQIQNLTGIKIDHFVVVNFEGFKSMVDAIGGVNVCIPNTWDDRAHGIYLKAGTRKISGNQALQYVRIRHVPGTDGTDLGRIKRQQAFVGSMVNAVLSSNTLTNPVKVVKFLDAATKSLTVDPGLKNLSKIAGLATEFKGIGMNKIKFVTVPWAYSTAYPGRVVWRPEAAQVWNAIKHDKPLSRSLTAGSINVSNLPGTATASPTAGAGSSASTSPSASASPSASDSPSGSASGSGTPSGSSTRSAQDTAALEQAGLCT
ncbi:LCP family protein [Nocardioides sp. BP30]|uniref:LCP family protein n=1 Tax=Nocardioides sp. BP30 TaxID=3036374 RepID=UPI0024693171|nr:LCP family protein [Nocardioides sp. BP30]WGL51885.1 LCP family protein [Nocardioides sp. BP30]